MKFVLVTLLIFKVCSCEKYCKVNAAASGIFLYNSLKGKDDPFIGNISYWSSPTKKIDFKVYDKNWELVDSLVDNLPIGPVVDVRWETFLYNHNDHIRIERILRKNQTKNIFLSVQLKKSLSTLSANQWNHLKVNETGIYTCDLFNDTGCSKKLNTIEKIHDFYRNHGTDIWKLQNYTYWITRKNNTKTCILQNFDNNSVSNRQCFIFFIAMCKMCKMKIEAESSFNFRSFDFEGENSWKTITFCVNNLRNITIQTFSKEDDAFWALNTFGYFSNFFDYRFMQYEENNYVCESAANEAIEITEELAESTTFNVDIKFEMAKTSDNFNFFYIYEKILIGLAIAAIMFLLIYICYEKKKNATEEIEREHSLHFLDVKFAESTLHLLSNGEAVYEDLEKFGPTEIKMEYFEKYVDTIFQEKNFDLCNQYFALPEVAFEKCKQGSKSDNDRKNSYTNVLPYDDNRVNLLKKSYINASYIRAFNNEKEYIITQNPIKSCIADFWEMIWQENITQIVMITAFNENYQMYWARLKRDLFFSNFQLVFEEEAKIPNATCIKRTFKFSRNKEIRQIFQYHYEAPEDGLHPTQSLLKFLNHVLKIPHYHAPVLFHCNDGCSMSGIILCCDIILRKLPISRTIDVYSTLQELRRQRMKVVSTLEHYKLVYKIIQKFLKEEL